jgi:translation initiation factor 3 subunit D
MDSILSLVQALPASDVWGPPVTTDTLRDGIPYAPFSKGDKLGRMADWTTEGKDREGRGGRQQYGRNFRGRLRQGKMCLQRANASKKSKERKQ